MDDNEKYRILIEKINVLYDSFCGVNSDFKQIEKKLEEGIVICGTPLHSEDLDLSISKMDTYLTKLLAAKTYCNDRIVEVPSELPANTNTVNMPTLGGNVHIATNNNLIKSQNSSVLLPSNSSVANNSLKTNSAVGNNNSINSVR